MTHHSGAFRCVLFSLLLHVALLESRILDIKSLPKFSNIFFHVFFLMYTNSSDSMIEALSSLSIMVKRSLTNLKERFTPLYFCIIIGISDFTWVFYLSDNSIVCPK